MTDQPPSSFLPEALSSKTIAALYACFLEAPSNVDTYWRSFFENLSEEAESVLRSHLPERKERPQKAAAPSQTTLDGLATDQAATIDSIRSVMLIRAVRTRGHAAAHLDPLGLQKPPYLAELDPLAYGFGEKDMDRPIFLGGTLGLQSATMREIDALLRATYCGSVGIEFMHIQNPAQKAWIQEHFENPDNRPRFTTAEKRQILAQMIATDAFETFLATRYPSVQRFSLEGAEALFPLLIAAFQRGADLGLEEIVVGMAHRGRLNLMANLFDKPLVALFSEIQGTSASPDEAHASGDLKYHLGFSTDRRFGSRTLHLSLTANPSHLEIVDPVVMGRVRAKQQQRIEDMIAPQEARHRVMGCLIHGDAALAGQGIVAETMMLAELEGTTTGGTVHVVVNNQIGFTTSPKCAHSGIHCTDVAKTIQAPVFHVNADDIDEVIHCAQLAAAYRQKFHRDVIIDLVCFRRNGHSEKDDPSIMHPLMVRKIKEKKTASDRYALRLMEEDDLTMDDYLAFQATAQQKLEKAYTQAQTFVPQKADWLEGHWMGYAPPPSCEQPVDTGYAIDRLRLIGERLCAIPQDFTPHGSLTAFIEKRQMALRSGEGIDWALAEALAFASLALDKTPVRLSGQDSERGTFRQRYATWVDQENGGSYYPFKNLAPDQSPIDIINSPLSEAAVLGFDYGYSLASPESLVCWEAQFGDFANGAQIIIDQFIASAEAKWLRLSGIVLLLPHAYEGQGPEHSSARLERFLQLCADDNIQVANCSTPANLFHILRRQMVRNYRKPLILMTPKSLLRNPLCVSALDDMQAGTHFHAVLDDTDTALRPKEEIKRVVLCSGKVAYDLFAARRATETNDVAIVRIEQFYPFPAAALGATLQTYPNAKIVWCQEEPANMGAAFFMDKQLARLLAEINHPERAVTCIARPESASPACGSLEKHLVEQEKIVTQALG